MKPPKKLPNELSLPDTYEAPDLEDGEEFDAVVTLRRKGDKYCAVKLDGEDMPGYYGKDEERDDADEPDDDDKPSMAKATRRVLKDY